MKSILILLILLLSFEYSYSGGDRPLIVYKEDGQNIEVYQKTFSGICYILLKNKNRGYGIVCELNKKRKVFMWKGTGNNSLITYNAVTDSAGSKFTGFHLFDLDKATTPAIDRIYISALETQLLYEGIKKCSSPDAKAYPHDLKKILFFAYADCKG